MSKDNPMRDVMAMGLLIFTDIRPFLNLIRKRGFKWAFMVVDDLWLYQYHKRDYDGIVKNVFITISFIEERQWESIGLDAVLNNVSGAIEDMPKYDKESNEKYVEESGNNNFMLGSVLDFFLFFTPLVFVTVFLFNRVFYLLFNYEVSSWLRPDSFWWILLELLVQNNIEYFAFLGIRTMETMFSFSFSSKAINGFFIVFVFIVFMTALTSYSFYLRQYTPFNCRYGKLARYFLSNLYRFPSSYVLMTIQYGTRPLLKGLIHVIFYEDWVLQLYLLSAVELTVALITLFW